MLRNVRPDSIQTGLVSVIIVEFMIMLFNYSPDIVRQGLLRVAFLLLLIIVVTIGGLLVQRQRLRQEQKTLNFSKKVSVREYERQKVRNNQKHVLALT